MSKSAKTVDHLGRVTEITLNDVKVTILSQSACSACHAKGMCSIADSAEKVIAVSKPNHNFILGQSVKVILRQSLGFKALFIGYLLPLILIISTLVILNALNFSELHAGLLSLAIMIPYYLILYFLKDIISRKFTFDIETIS